MMQQQMMTTTTTTTQQMMVPFGNAANGGYDTGMNAQMFMVTTTTTTVTIVQSFGFSPVYQPVPVNPQALQNYQQFRNDKDGVYEGPYDENGQRSGVGTCKWPDGSVYEGDWLNGLRHGSGKYTCDDYIYIGEWQQDMRHGRGKYTKLSNEDKESQAEDSEDEDKSGNLPIFAPWENDKLNGLGTQGDQTVLFKDGMRVVLSGHEKDAGKICKYVCTFISNILCYACIVGTIITQLPIAIYSIVVYAFYQVISCQSDATRYLSNCMSAK